MAPNPRRCAPAGTEWAIQKRRTDKEAKRKDCGPALYADQQSETSQSDQERLAVLTGLCTISKLVCYTSLSIFIIYHAKGKESNYWSCSQKPSKNGQKITGHCLFLSYAGVPRTRTTRPLLWPDLGCRRLCLRAIILYHFSSIWSNLMDEQKWPLFSVANLIQNIIKKARSS